MSRAIAFVGLVTGMAALMGCGDNPQAPAPVRQPPAAPSTLLGPPVVVPPPPDPTSNSLAGSYTMALDIGSECAVIPAADRSRRYTATIASHQHGGYLATLAGSTFLSGSICTSGSGRFAGVGCDQFFVSADGENVRIALENNNDEAHGGHIDERTASGAWMEIIGTADGRLGPSGIEASGTAHVWYCPTVSSYPFPCRSFVGCDAKVQVTLTRQ